MPPQRTRRRKRHWAAALSQSDKMAAEKPSQTQAKPTLAQWALGVEISMKTGWCKTKKHQCACALEKPSQQYKSGRAQAPLSHSSLNHSLFTSLWTEISPLPYTSTWLNSSITPVLNTLLRSHLPFRTTQRNRSSIVLANYSIEASLLQSPLLFVQQLATRRPAYRGSNYALTWNIVIPSRILITDTDYQLDYHSPRITFGLPLDYHTPNGLLVILERVDIGYIRPVLGYGCTLWNPYLASTGLLWYCTRLRRTRQICTGIRLYHLIFLFLVANRGHKSYLRSVKRITSRLSAPDRLSRAHIWDCTCVCLDRNPIVLLLVRTIVLSFVTHCTVTASIIYVQRLCAFLTIPAYINTAAITS